MIRSSKAPITEPKLVLSNLLRGSSVNEVTLVDTLDGIDDGTLEGVHNGTGHDGALAPMKVHPQTVRL
jgi:hypothetical protein